VGSNHLSAGYVENRVADASTGPTPPENATVARTDVEIPVDPRDRDQSDQDVRSDVRERTGTDTLEGSTHGRPVFTTG
jgi:hypothetical protein